jgi:hypothetical protein
VRATRISYWPRARATRSAVGACRLYYVVTAAQSASGHTGRGIYKQVCGEIQDRANGTEADLKERVNCSLDTIYTTFILC